MTRRRNLDDSAIRLAVFGVVVGLVAGVGAGAFRALIAAVHNLSFLGTFSARFDANQHTPLGALGAGVILVPAIGGLVVACLVKNFAPEAKGHGVPEIMDAIYFGRAIIRPVVAVVKSLASAITIGTGGSVGREGPIAQIGASFGSTLGQLARLPAWQRVTLIAAGAGSGIAATFNTPIGGLLFAVELILTEISARTLIPVALATGAATSIGRIFFGDAPAFDIPTLTLHQIYAEPPIVLLAYGLLGVLLGGAGWLFVRSIYGFEDLFERMPGNYYSRHVSGMLGVGLMIYACSRAFGHYYVEGVGYATVQDVLTDTLTNPALLLTLFFVKLLATSLTLGSGGSGGIFSPSLFLGATLAGAYGLLLNRFFPTLHLDVTGVAVIGMAGLVGAATGAAVTAIVMIFEMTRDYDVIVPLMVTVSLAYGVRRLLLADSVYTLKLSRRGHHVPYTLQTHWLMGQKAGDLLRTPVISVGGDGQVPGALWGPEPRVPPHVVVFDQGKVRKVVTVEGLMEKEESSERTTDADGQGFIVVGAQDLIWDVAARLRVDDAEVALVTADGKLEGPHSVLGVLTRDELAKAGNLPAWYTRRIERQAKGSG